MKPRLAMPAFLVRCATALLLAAAAPAFGADVPLDVSAIQQQLGRLAPDVPATQLTFDVDAGAGRLDFDIGSPAPGLILVISGPAGQRITPGTIGGFGGTYGALPAAGNVPGSPGIYPFSPASPRYRFQLPTLGAGTYTVRATAPGLAEQFPVVAQLLTDSPIAARLLFTDANGIVGRRSVLCAAIVDGTQPLAGATVTAQLLDPQHAVHTLALLDDGGENDGQAGDGMYCAGFTPAIAGTYDALADIQATDGAGQHIRRQTAARHEVDGATAAFTGTFGDHGVDLDGNGRFDYVALVADVDVAVAGAYRALATLRTASGVQFEGVTDQLLNTGAGQVEIRLDALRLQALRENGPYTVERIDLLLLEEGNVRLADVLPQPGQTQAYTLDQLERPAIILTGSAADRGIDTDGNGLFDLLEITLEVDVASAGDYQFSARLTDGAGRHIALAAAAAALPAGRRMVTFVFNGRLIGAHGIDGPYILDNFLMFGAGAALTVPGPVARTSAYRYSQFEAGAANPADVNGDGQVDCADTALVRAGFGRRAGQPGFDPRTDVNGDGVTDVRDLTLVARALPTGIRCP